MSASGSRGPWRFGGAGGQVAIEYFMLFAVVAVVCIVTLTAFDDAWRGTVQQFVGRAAERIAREDPNAR